MEVVKNILYDLFCLGSKPQQRVTLRHARLTSNCCVTTCRYHNISHVMRKPTFCICENKDADQLCSNSGADQRLCFRCKDSILYFLNPSTFKIRNFKAVSIFRCTARFVSDLVGNENVSFLTSWLIYYIPFSQAINKQKNTYFLCFQCKQTFYRKKIKDMLLRFEPTSSDLRVLRLAHCNIAADRDNTQFHC